MKLLANRHLTSLERMLPAAQPSAAQLRAEPGLVRDRGPDPCELPTEMQIMALKVGSAMGTQA